MGDIDWEGIPLDHFGAQQEVGENGRTTGRWVFVHGEGEAQSVMARLANDVEDAYAGLLSEEDLERLVSTGELPIMREGARRYEPIDVLTLWDLPAVLDTLTVLEEERGHEAEEERERKAAERKERERVRAKERRKLKKLGE
jgi:hypothetical protein